MISLSASRLPKQNLFIRIGITPPLIKVWGQTEAWLLRAHGSPFSDFAFNMMRFGVNWLGLLLLIGVVGLHICGLILEGKIQINSGNIQLQSLEQNPQSSPYRQVKSSCTKPSEVALR